MTDEMKVDGAGGEKSVQPSRQVTRKDSRYRKVVLAMRSSCHRCR